MASAASVASRAAAWSCTAGFCVQRVRRDGGSHCTSRSTLSSPVCVAAGTAALVNAGALVIEGDLRDAELAGDRVGGRLVVAGQHHDADAFAAQGVERLNNIGVAGG